MLTFLFILSEYLLIPALTFSPIISHEILSWLHLDSSLLGWAVMILIPLLLTGLTFAFAVTLLLKTLKGTAIIRKRWLVLKFAPIPLFVANFVLFPIYAAILFPASVFIVPLNCFYCFILIAFTGVFGFIYLRQLKNDSTKTKTAYTVMQFIPVLDVISTVIISKKY